MYANNSGRVLPDFLTISSIPYPNMEMVVLLNPMASGNPISMQVSPIRISKSASSITNPSGLPPSDSHASSIFRDGSRQISNASDTSEWNRAVTSPIERGSVCQPLSMAALYERSQSSSMVIDPPY